MNPVWQVLVEAALGDVGCLAGLAPGSWSEVRRAAAMEGLEGLLHCRCHTAGLAPPAHVAHDWAAAHRTTAAATWVALMELQRLLQALAAAGVPALVLPGAALLPHYPDVGCRPMDDVDLLVPTGAQAAAAAAAPLGYLPVPRYPGLLAGPRLLVDLHDDPLNSDRIEGRAWGGVLPTSTAWSARGHRSLGSFVAPVLNPVDEVLYTAAHAVRHSYRRLHWTIDLAQQVRRLDHWEAVAQRAQACGLEWPLAAALWPLVTALGQSLPLGAAAWLAARPPTSWQDRLLRRAWRDRPAGSWGDLLWAAGVAGRRRRCRFLARCCFPRPAVLLQVFTGVPARLAALTYPLRVAQLAHLGARSLGRAIWRR